MARTTAFGILPSPSGGRGAIFAAGTVASVVNGGSFSVQLNSAGSQQLRNITSAVISPLGPDIYGTAVVATASGSSNGYVTVNLWDNGTGTIPVRAGTVDLNFHVIGGAGSI